ncbi:MAG: hypothetical protein WC048_08705 [Rhizobium sp.]
MRFFGLASTVLILALSLSACNTTDALTPQVDVGGSVPSATSGSLTQSDLDQMADMGEGQVQSSSLPQPGYVSPPQNTLEAQAQALAAGNQPMQPPPPVQQASQPQESRQPAQETAALPVSTGDTVRFLPIIGAPVQAVTPLSRQLGAEARANGLTIKSSNDAASDHILKGYFSAFGEGGQVTVVYVWDILDANGSRLHRIQGQEVVRSNGSDPWAGVPASLMQQIATKTIAEYLGWRRGQRG